LELPREFNDEKRQNGQKTANSLFFSLFSGNPAGDADHQTCVGRPTEFEF
jgi:hypothetical protein